MVGKWNSLLLTAGMGVASPPLYVDGKGVSNNDCGVWAKQEEQTACTPTYVNRKTHIDKHVIKSIDANLCCSYSACIEQALARQADSGDKISSITSAEQTDYQDVEGPSPHFIISASMQNTVD